MKLFIKAVIRSCVSNKMLKYRVVFFGLDSSILILVTCFSIESETSFNKSCFSINISSKSSKALNSNTELTFPNNSVN